MRFLPIVALKCHKFTVTIKRSCLGPIHAFFFPFENAYFLIRSRLSLTVKGSKTELLENGFKTGEFG